MTSLAAASQQEQIEALQPPEVTAFDQEVGACEPIAAIEHQGQIEHVPGEPKCDHGVCLQWFYLPTCMGLPVGG